MTTRAACRVPGAGRGHPRGLRGVRQLGPHRAPLEPRHRPVRTGAQARGPGRYRVQISSLSTQYLHSIYTVSTQYLYSIYTVSTQYLPTQVRCLALDGHRILTGDVEGYVYAWDLDNCLDPGCGPEKLCLRAHNAMDPDLYCKVGTVLSGTGPGDVDIA